MDEDHVLILDLASTTNPQFDRLVAYFGRPFVYCMLHNYGGVDGLYGKAETINREPYVTRLGYSNFVGLGITPEGLHNSYVMYELFMEAFWRSQPLADLEAWFGNFSHRR